MKSKKVDENTYFLRLTRGEDVFETITSFLKQEQISCGEVRAIGSLEKYCLAYYDGKEYLPIQKEEHVELISLMGNISLKDGEPFPHMHAVISGITGSCIGGHVLLGNIVSYVVEVIITKFEETVERKYDPNSNLILWDL